MQYGNSRLTQENKKKAKQFKSYYVVWKQEIKKKNREYEKRLNRTMQYGNFLYSHALLYRMLFKSYYVVWKQKGMHKTGQKFKSLNRTMQYGNEPQKH